MNRAFGVDEYARSSRRQERRRERGGLTKPKRWTVVRWVGAVVVLGLALSMGLVQARTAAGNPDHFAGDYVIFAKALNPTVTTDLETREASCNGLGSNNSQGEASGQNNTYFGRIHSNADLALNGANTYADTISPDTEITYGVHEPGDCALQQDVGSVFADPLNGLPLDIANTGDAAGGNGNPASIHGPYQIGSKGWPGTLGDFINSDETFTNTTTTSGSGFTCATGTSLVGNASDLVIDNTNAASFENKVVCHGTKKIVFSATDQGTLANPYRITFVSHGTIEVPGARNTLAPAGDGHGVLAWTDEAWPTNKPGIKISGSDTNIPRRSILFAPRNSIDVSGSDQDAVCIQAIGQGRVKIAGSKSQFGPFAPGCANPATVVTDIHANLQGNAHFSLGQSGAVEVGTQVHDQVTVSSTTTVGLSGTMDFRRFNTGNCQAPIGESDLDEDVPGTPLTHVFEDILPFTSATAGIFSYQAEYNGDATNLAATSPCEGPIRFVDARITLNPPTGTNAVGDPHQLTGHVDVNDGEGFDPAPDGTTISFAMVSGSGTLSAPSCVTSGGTGSCSVNLNNTAAGTDTVSASTTVTVSGVSLTRSTAGNAGPGGSGNATKTWVDANIQITPATGANEVGTQHQLTGHVNVNPGTGFVNAPEGTQINFAIASGPGSLSAASCLTVGTTGSCSVNLTSGTAGVTTVNASTSVVVGGVTVNRTTDGTGLNSGPATKNWVAVRISITPPNDANEAGSDHVLTITLEQSVSAGVWTPLAGETVGATITNSNGATAAFVGPGTCVTGAGGTCTVTINSPTAGTTSVEATWAGGTVGGAAISAKTSNPDASKTWVKVRISITPLNDDNEVGTNHELTITLEKSVSEGTWTPLAGETVGATLTNENGATATFVGGSTCVTGAAGTCTLTISSPTAGSTTIEATWAGGTVEGASVSAKTSNPDADKDWIAVRISIGPLNATNPVGTNHVLTITLEQSVSAGVWTGLNGETVSASLTNSGGATATFVGGNTCVTAGSGQCTVTISSPTPGTTTVEATWAGGTVAGATITAKVTEPDATKLWQAAGATLLIIDEDSIDNGIHFNASGGLITPSGPQFFGDRDVNDDRPGTRQRTVLRYFTGDNIGDLITVKTGQTGDEGWFAPTCIPQKWVSGSSNTCLEGAARQTGISNYFGASGSSAIPSQSRLDKIPAVMPLRSLGLTSLVGRKICAVVYDSDISINYNSSNFPFTDGNLQGETLGVISFTVTEVRTLNGFSSSTLPQVTLRIEDATGCNPSELFNAPVPTSSSVPNDRLVPPSTSGYRQQKTFPDLPLFF